MASPDQPELTVILQDESLRQFEGGFTSIPNRILANNELSLGARMTYAMLLKYAWQKDFCFPAQERIAQDLGISDRSVRTFLVELRELDLIDWKQQGLNRPNVYYVKRLPPPPGQQTPPRNGKIFRSGSETDSVQERKHTSDKEYPKKNTNVDNVNRSISGKEDSSERRLTRDEYAKATGLALQIQDTIGQPENYRSYFVCAAHAVRRGTRGVHALGEVLSATKDLMRRGGLKKTPSQYFHGAWKRVLPTLGSELPRPAAIDESPESETSDGAAARLAVQEFLARPRMRRNNET